MTWWRKQKKRQAFHLSLLYLDSWLLILNQYPYRLFQQAFEGLQVGCAGCAVHHAVVAGEGQLHHVAWYYCAIFHYRHLLNTANSQYTGSRRIDDRGKLIYAEHAQVGY